MLGYPSLVLQSSGSTAMQSGSGLLLRQAHYDGSCREWKTYHMGSRIPVVGCALNSASSNISNNSTHMTTTCGVVRLPVHQKSTQLWLTDTWFRLAILRGIVLMCEQKHVHSGLQPQAGIRDLGFHVWGALSSPAIGSPYCRDCTHEQH